MPCLWLFFYEKGVTQDSSGNKKLGILFERNDYNLYTKQQLVQCLKNVILATIFIGVYLLIWPAQI